MEFQPWYVPIWVLAAFIAYTLASLRRLKRTELGVIYGIDDNIVRAVDGGALLVVWLGLHRLDRYPKMILEHKIKLPPVWTQQLEEAVFYTQDGKERRFTDLGEAERTRVLAEPAHQRIPIMVEATLLYRLTAENMWAFIDNAQGSLEKLISLLDTAFHTALHDEFGHITAGTALERRDIIGKNVKNRLRRLTGEIADGEEHYPHLGNETIMCQVGPLAVPAEMEAQYVAAAASIKAKSAAVTEAEAKRERIRIISEALKTDEGLVAAFYEEKVPQALGNSNVSLIMADTPIAGIAAGIGKIFKIAR